MKLLPAARPPLTNVLLIDGACAAAAVLYTVVDRPMPQFVDLFVIFAPIIAVTMWFQKYLRQVHYSVPFDFGYFFMMGWLILIPAITKRSTVERPRRLALVLYGLALAPSLCATLVNILMFVLR